LFFFDRATGLAAVIFKSSRELLKLVRSLCREPVNFLIFLFPI
jgi:hypothetical protein